MVLKRNNPGNIRKNEKYSWQGEVPGTLPGEFVNFDTLVNGYRAQIKLLNNYVKAGYNTLNKIVYRWAPPSDNNPTNEYIGTGGINFIQSGLNLDRDRIIQVNDFDTLANVAYQMSLFEHGVPGNVEMQSAVLKAKAMFTGIIETVKNNPGKVLLFGIVSYLFYQVIKKINQ